MRTGVRRFVPDHRPTMALDVAGALRTLREKKGLSQGDVWRITGIDREYLSRLENGKILNPRLETIMQLADAMGVGCSDVAALALEMGQKKKKGGRDGRPRGQRSGTPSPLMP